MAPGYHFRPPLHLRLLSLVFTQKKSSESWIILLPKIRSSSVQILAAIFQVSALPKDDGVQVWAPSQQRSSRILSWAPALKANRRTCGHWFHVKKLRVSQTLDIDGKSAIKTSTNEKHLKGKSGDWFDEKMAKSFKGHFAALLMMQSLVLIQSSLVQIDSDRLYQRLTVQVTDQVPRHLCQNTLIQLEVRSILILFRFFFYSNLKMMVVNQNDEIVRRKV